MLRIDKKLDTRSIESAYNIINVDQPDLFLSRKISDEFGIVPAIIQLISTWFSKVPDGVIRLEANDETNLQDFYDMDYFFPSITYCWGRDILDAKGEDLKSRLRIHNVAAHEKMAKQSGGGFKMLLSCFDHLSKRKGLLNAFYVDGEFIDNEIYFGMSIDKALKHVVSFNRQMTKNLAKVYLDLIDIIYELVKNTDNWATTDEFNRPISPSTRGLYMKFHKKQQSTLLAEFHEQEGIRNYFSTTQFEKNAQDEVYFLELSVYDTGIGYVQRYKPRFDNEVYTAAEQVDIIKDCLLMNNTSATGISQKVKGKGLDRIMNILNNKGFFWIRTGNVSLYRNLRQNKYEAGCAREHIHLYDFKTDSSKKFSKFEYGLGSVVSIIYPISTLLNE